VTCVRDCRDKGYLRRITSYVARGSELAAWQPSEIKACINAFEGHRTFGVFGALYGMRTEFAEWIAELKQKRPRCECGSCNVQYQRESDIIMSEPHSRSRHQTETSADDAGTERPRLGGPAWPIDMSTIADPAVPCSVAGCGLPAITEVLLNIGWRPRCDFHGRCSMREHRPLGNKATPTPFVRLPPLGLAPALPRFPAAPSGASAPEPPASLPHPWGLAPPDPRFPAAPLGASAPRPPLPCRTPGG